MTLCWGDPTDELSPDLTITHANSTRLGQPSLLAVFLAPLENSFVFVRRNLLNIDR